MILTSTPFVGRLKKILADKMSGPKFIEGLRITMSTALNYALMKKLHLAILAYYCGDESLLVRSKLLDGEPLNFKTDDPTESNDILKVRIAMSYLLNVTYKETKTLLSKMHYSTKCTVFYMREFVKDNKSTVY